MIDNRTFEVYEVVQEDNLYKIIGRVFHRLKVGDKLIIGNQELSEFCLLIIKDIMAYQRHLEEIHRGYACQITVEVEGECNVDFNWIRYLYKSTDNDDEPPIDPDYLDETAAYVFGKTLVQELEYGYEITGTSYHLIKIGDKLTITNEAQEESPILVVKDITTRIQQREYHVTEIERGLPATLIVEKTGDVDLINNKYLYKVEEQ